MQEVSRSFVLWDNSEGEFPLAIGFAVDYNDTLRIIDDYFRYSFCKGHLDAENYPWHIRLLINGERTVFPFRLADAGSLCEKISFSNCTDLIAPVDLRQKEVCEECAWLFWQAEGKRKENDRT